MKKILMTSGAGFFGSSLIESLISIGDLDRSLIDGILEKSFY